MQVYPSDLPAAEIPVPPSMPADVAWEMRGKLPCPQDTEARIDIIGRQKSMQCPLHQSMECAGAIVESRGNAIPGQKWVQNVVLGRSTVFTELETDWNATVATQEIISATTGGTLTTVTSSMFLTKVQGHSLLECGMWQPRSTSLCGAGGDHQSV